MKNIIFIFIVNIFVFFPIKAQNQIKHLPNGALLIRLNTNEHIINYHLKENNIQQANVVKNQQKKINKEIIENFKTEWSLSLVYFFYSKDSDQVIKNNFENVFKDVHETKLNDSEKMHLNKNFIIGYFGRSRGPLKFDALILTNEQLKTLKRPQPRIVRTYKGLWFLERKLSRIIQILEKKIKFYHLRIQ